MIAAYLCLSEAILPLLKNSPVTLSVTVVTVYRISFTRERKDKRLGLDPCESIIHEMIRAEREIAALQSLDGVV